jgi:hypothetical protein
LSRKEAEAVMQISSNDVVVGLLVSMRPNSKNNELDVG